MSSSKICEQHLSNSWRDADRARDERFQWLYALKNAIFTKIAGDFHEVKERRAHPGDPYAQKRACRRFFSRSRKDGSAPSMAAAGWCAVALPPYGSAISIRFVLSEAALIATVPTNNPAAVQLLRC